MQILRGTKELDSFLDTHSAGAGCLADTGFLYALAYKDDRLFEMANDIHDVLVDRNIPIYANVISRMEMIDLIFRKQVTIGCVQLFEEATSHAFDKPAFNLLKDIRDKDTAAKRKKESYKVDEGRLKKLRKNLVNDYGLADWADFCAKYVGQMLTNEWLAIEEDLGLNFVEVMEGQTSDLFKKPLLWSDLVRLMGDKGLRGPDAMIVNLFDKSNFEILVTSDSDFENCFTDLLQQASDRAILVL